MSLVNIKPYLNQDYDRIKSDCIRSGVLFQDEYFPADQTSISWLNNQASASNEDEYEYAWKRPHEIIRNPKFITNGIDPSDINQGKMGSFY